jgi:transposase-like protein
VTAARTPASAPAPGGRRKPAPAGEVARLYRVGLTMGEIAAIFQVSAWVIGSRLEEAGVRRRAPGEQGGLPVDRAVRRYRRQPHLLGELAAGLGIHPQLLVDRAARPAPADRGQGTYRADVHAADVADLYRAGWTVKQIAGKCGTTTGTVLRRLEQAGVTRRPKSLPAPFPAEEAARRVRENQATFAALSREYGVSDGAVRYRMAAMGVPAAVHAPRVLAGFPAADIARLYQGGLTVGGIAVLHGVSRWTISARLGSADVTLRPAGKVLPLEEAAAQYAAGESLAAIGARYGMSAGTVGGKLTAAGIVLRPPGGRRIPVPVGEAVGLYAGGQTMAQLAARYGVCPTVIYDRLVEAGAPIRRRTDFKQVDAGLLASLAAQIGLEVLP